MKTCFYSLFLTLAVTCQGVAAGEPEHIWGPMTNNVMMSILVRNDSPAFTADEFNDAAALIGRIKQHEDKVSTFLWEQSPQQAQSAFMAFQPSAINAKQVKESLADVLNKAISGPNIYTVDRFSGSRLTGETRILLGKHPVGTNLVALNRMLLEDCYPFELARGLKPDGTRVKKGQPIVLIVSMKNLSTNETFFCFLDSHIESSLDITVQIVTPSGKTISPSTDPHTAGKGNNYRLSPGQWLHLTFHLNDIFNFDEIGRYLITCEFGIHVPEKPVTGFVDPPGSSASVAPDVPENPLAAFLVSSNPLPIQIDP
jgi:hypothetical protein